MNSSSASPGRSFSILQIPFCPNRRAFELEVLADLPPEAELTGHHAFEVRGTPVLVIVIEWSPPREPARTHLESTPGTKARDARPPALGEKARADLERFHTWRRETAERAGVPPFLVFNNRELEDIARARPENLAQLAAVRGVGAAKLKRYGTDVLALLGMPTPKTPAKEPPATPSDIEPGQ
ncbi:MAG: HRDC domain-containing protein [Planctomycetota bacterium]